MCVYSVEGGNFAAKLVILIWQKRRKYREQQHRSVFKQKRVLHKFSLHTETLHSSLSHWTAQCRSIQRVYKLSYQYWSCSRCSLSLFVYWVIWNDSTERWKIKWKKGCALGSLNTTHVMLAVFLRPWRSLPLKGRRGGKETFSDGKA